MKVDKNKSYEELSDEIAQRFIRIGTVIYKVSYVPSAYREQSENHSKRLAQWNKETIRADFGGTLTKMVMEKIKKADGYALDVSHTNYQEFIENSRGDLFYNLYEPIPYQPKEGSCENILKYMRHLFCPDVDQLEEGLDYIKLLYENPMQKLPILCLVSKERETAKTTFLNLLTAIFGNNSYFIRGDDLKSSFNNDWATKLCVCLDDADVRKPEYAKMLRMVSTAMHLPVEGKGKTRENQTFFGKIIITSNLVDDFAYIDNEENRYWVRYVHPVKKEERHDGNYFRDVLVPEIPAFLHYIKNRELKHKKEQSRMWFPYSAINTPWLEGVRKRSAPGKERELVDFLTEMFEAMPNINELKYRVGTIRSILKERLGYSVSELDTKQMIFERFKITTAKKTERFIEYTDFDNPDKTSNGEPYEQKEVGKPYTFTREMVMPHGIAPVEAASPSNAVMEESKSKTNAMEFADLGESPF